MILNQRYHNNKLCLIQITNIDFNTHIFILVEYIVILIINGEKIWKITIFFIKKLKIIHYFLLETRRKKKFMEKSFSPKLHSHSI